MKFSETEIYEEIGKRHYFPIIRINIFLLVELSVSRANTNFIYQILFLKTTNKQYKKIKANLFNSITRISELNNKKKRKKIKSEEK